MRYLAIVAIALFITMLAMAGKEKKELELLQAKKLQQGPMPNLLPYQITVGFDDGQ